MQIPISNSVPGITVLQQHALTLFCSLFNFNSSEIQEVICRKWSNLERIRKKFITEKKFEFFFISCGDFILSLIKESTSIYVFFALYTFFWFSTSLYFLLLQKLFIALMFILTFLIFFFFREVFMLLATIFVFVFVFFFCRKILIRFVRF